MLAPLQGRHDLTAELDPRRRSARCGSGSPGADVASFDTDRDAFLGPYRTPSRPSRWRRGECSGTETVGDNSCASLHARLELAPGETRHVIYMLGVGNPDAPWDGLGRVNPVTTACPRAASSWRSTATPERVEAELAAIRAEWRDYLAPLQVLDAGRARSNSMVNVWHAYQTHMTFNWSRGVSPHRGRATATASATATRCRTCWRSRTPSPSAVRERLDLILTGQTAEGGAMPLVKPLTHNPGHEATPTLEEYRSDDALWLPITVANFVLRDGRRGYLEHGAAVRRPRRGDGLRAPRCGRSSSRLAHRGSNGLVQGLQGGLERRHPVRHHGRVDVLHVPHGERPAGSSRSSPSRRGATTDAAWARGELEPTWRR